MDRLASDLEASKAQLAAATDRHAAALAAGSQRAAQLQAENDQLRARLQTLERASGRGALELVDTMNAQERELSVALGELARLRARLANQPASPGSARPPASPLAAAQRAAGASTPSSDGPDVDSDDSDSSMELYVADKQQAQPRLVTSKLQSKARVIAQLRALKQRNEAKARAKAEADAAAAASQRSMSASAAVRAAMRAASRADSAAALLSDEEDDLEVANQRSRSYSQASGGGGSASGVDSVAETKHKVVGLRTALRAITAVRGLRKKAVEHKQAHEAVGGGAGKRVRVAVCGCVCADMCGCGCVCLCVCLCVCRYVWLWLWLWCCGRGRGTHVPCLYRARQVALHLVTSTPRTSRRCEYVNTPHLLSREPHADSPLLPWWWHQSFLKSVPLFQSLNEKQLDKLVASVGRATFADGDIIIQQGDDGDMFYVIESGLVRIFKGDDECVADRQFHVPPLQLTRLTLVVHRRVRVCLCSGA